MKKEKDKLELEYIKELALEIKKALFYFEEFLILTDRYAKELLKVEGYSPVHLVRHGRKHTLGKVPLAVQTRKQLSRISSINKRINKLLKAIKKIELKKSAELSEAKRWFLELLERVEYENSRNIENLKEMVDLLKSESFIDEKTIRAMRRIIESIISELKGEEIRIEKVYFSKEAIFNAWEEFEQEFADLVKVLNKKRIKMKEKDAWKLIKRIRYAIQKYGKRGFRVSIRGPEIHLIGTSVSKHWNIKGNCFSKHVDLHLIVV